MLPEERNALKKNSPAELRGRRTHQGRRCLFDRTDTGEKRRADRTDCCGGRCENTVGQAIGNRDDLQVGIKDAVGFDDDIGKHFFPEQNSENASGQRCGKGVEHVFSRNLCRAVAEGEHRADLRAFLLDHPRHCGKAYEGRHEEKDYGEYFSERADPPRVAVKAGIGGNRITPEDVPVRILHGSNLRFPVLDFLKGFRQLFFGVGLFRFKLPLCRVQTEPLLPVILCASLKLREALPVFDSPFLQRLLPFREPFAGFLELGLANAESDALGNERSLGAGIGLRMGIELRLRL